jgi:hypothetical protein
MVDARQSSHVFDSAPGQRWTLRARTRNEAGQSPWSASVSAATVSSAQSQAEPLDGPFVSFAQGIPRLSWRGREGADPELVDHFVVEWRSRTEPRWNQLARKVPFAGWQRPYSSDLDQLPGGHVYETRVRAVDHNLGTVFLSGMVGDDMDALPMSMPPNSQVTVQAQAQCQPPRAIPRGVQVIPLGPNQLRLGWQPLAESEWNCDRLWYVVKYSSDEQQASKHRIAGKKGKIINKNRLPHSGFQKCEQWREQRRLRLTSFHRMAIPSAGREPSRCRALERCPKQPNAGHSPGPGGRLGCPDAGPGRGATVVAGPAVPEWPDHWL